MRPEYLEKGFAATTKYREPPVFWRNMHKTRKCAYFTAVENDAVPGGYETSYGYINPGNIIMEDFLLERKNERLLDAALVKIPREYFEKFGKQALAGFRMAVNLGKEIDR